MKDPYKILKIKRTATEAQIKKAFRKRSIETHPDKGGTAEEFVEVKEAYNLLKDPTRRALFDEQGITDETKAEQNFYNEVVELFFNAIATIPAPAYEHDIITFINNNIDEKIETSAKHMKGLAGNITALKKFKGKIHRKETEDSTENMFENIIDGKIHTDETEIQFWKDDIIKQNKIKDIINQYYCATAKTKITDKKPEATAGFLGKFI